MQVVVTTTILNLSIMAVCTDGNESAGIKVFGHFSGVPLDEQMDLSFLLPKYRYKKTNTLLDNCSSFCYYK